MEKLIAGIEFGSKNIKLVVGYELKGQVYVIYTLCKPLNSLIDCGACEDRSEVIEALSSLSQISDPSAKLNLKFSGALAILPPNGLEVYQVKQTTSVISSEQKVCETDINNVYNIIRNGNLPIETNQLVDIVPNLYILDNDRCYDRPPYGEVSRQVTILGKVHTLPTHIVNDYVGLFRDANITIKRMAVAPHAAMELIKTYDDTPDEYFLVDIGSNVTTVSLAGQKQLFSSRSFSWGGDNITEKIIENFNINEADAEKYKILYGLDSREAKFQAPICSTEDADGTKIDYYPNDLNEIIKEELDKFVRQLNAAIDELLSVYDASHRKIPMLLIGGGSKLKGLVDYISDKVASEEVRTLTPKTIGARDPSLFSLLGLIYLSNRYPVAIDESQPKVGTVSRNAK